VPSLRHESLLALFRNRPALATELLEQGLGLALPAHDDLRLESAALTEVAPVPYRADLVVQLWNEGKLVLGVVVEAQLGPDPDKRFTWPLYVASLRARLGCPCWLLVLSPDASVARWCAEPINLGHPGHTLTPLVLGPEAVPVLVNAEQARAAPELAVLSAMAHGAGPNGLEVALAALGAAVGLDEERSGFYTDLVMASLDEAARQALEDLMSTGSYEYQSEFARRYVAQGEAKGKAAGKAEGEAKGVLVVLRARGLVVSPEVEDRITRCTDIAQLDEWLRRAVVVTNAEEIFG
jgi:hypothetical protein